MLRAHYPQLHRVAFQGGLFPGVNNRQMGLSVNGTVFTTTQSFPITGSFETYQHSFLQVHLNAGVNSISQFAVSDHGLSRVDEMTVTPATASVPGGPTNLAATASAGSVVLHWTASSSGSPTSYRVFRGTKSDGEAVTPIATTTGSTTTFTDTALESGTTYYYFVQAANAVGGSPNSNEVSAVPSTGGANLALGRPTTVSSIENAGTAAAKATDGDAGTRWSSAFADPQWIQVDLGANRTVSQVVVVWETAHATAYQIQLSDDGSTWTTIYSTTTGPGGTQTLNLAGTGRYLRLYATARNTNYGYSIWEPLVAEDRPLGDPASLLVTPDHYVTRLLHANGVPLDRLFRARPRDVWAEFCAGWPVFAGTATGYWLAAELHYVFGISDDPSPHHFDQLTDLLGQPDFRPRALFERFGVQVLATTDDPLDPLGSDGVPGIPQRTAEPARVLHRARRGVGRPRCTAHAGW